MNWNQIVEAIKEFFNQPIPIIGCTIGALGLLILQVISKTSIGKKSLNKIKSINDNLVSAQEKLVTEYNDFIEKKNKEIEELTALYDLKLSEITQKLGELKSFTIDTLKYINNKKIRESVEEFVNENTKSVEEIIQDEK